MTEKEYWKKRCELAESFLDVHVADPDITGEMTTAYRKWRDFKKYVPLPKDPPRRGGGIKAW